MNPDTRTWLAPSSTTYSTRSPRYTADTTTLDTLPAREFRAGYAERTLRERLGLSRPANRYGADRSQTGSYQIGAA